MRRRLPAAVCILALLFTLFVPIHANESICFTAVNDRILPLTDETMPVWSGGVLYVPYSVFDASATGVSLGVTSTYLKSSGIVSVFTLKNMLTFDLNDGTCRSQRTGTLLQGRAIIRNGTAYVPAGLVCSFFGLSYSYLHGEYGYMVRITSPTDEYRLPDDIFVDAGSNIMRNRLRDYNQSLQPEQPAAPVQPVQPTMPTVPTPEPEPEPTTVPTCLAVRCGVGQSTLTIAQALEQNDQTALFFFPAHDIGAQGGLIRRLLGYGHRIGILAEGESEQETQELLSMGTQALQTVAHIRTYFALVPDSQQSALSGEGWVFWQGGASVTPPVGKSSYTYISGLIRTLPKNGRAKLLLDDSAPCGELITPLLRQLASQGYILSIPRETTL